MIKYDVNNTPIVDLVNKIILVGVKSRASDIHFDPMEDGLKVRIRVDGDLRDHTIIPKDNERNGHIIWKKRWQVKENVIQYFYGAKKQICLRLP